MIQNEGQEIELSRPRDVLRARARLAITPRLAPKLPTNCLHLPSLPYGRSLPPHNQVVPSCLTPIFTAEDKRVVLNLVGRHKHAHLENPVSPRRTCRARPLASLEPRQCWEGILLCIDLIGPFFVRSVVYPFVLDHTLSIPQFPLLL